MTVRPYAVPIARLAAWALVIGLLLKAAAPMLASWAAGVRGLDVADVCSVYGVAVVDASRAPMPSSPGGGAMLGHDACTLASFAGAAPLPSQGAIVPFSAPEASPGSGLPRAAAPPCDACARWVARLQHAPPVRT